MGRVFKCSECQGSWTTSNLGRFTVCPACKETQLLKKRSKICGYRLCKQTFTDTSVKNTKKFCCAEHGRKEKAFRSGLAQDETYFRSHSSKLDPLCVTCGERWSRGDGDLAVRCVNCRKRAREKVCSICQAPFFDNSAKNTRKSHPGCVRSFLGIKPDRPVIEASKRLESRRRAFLRSGTHGRLDDMSSLKKGTHTWWGRVSELIFKRLHPDSEDANIIYGSTAPFDFMSPGLGKVDVRGAKARVSPEGRAMWAFTVDGLGESCDTVFLVGYTQDQLSVAFIWQIPSSRLPDRSLRMAPGSSEYVWGTYLLEGALFQANSVLSECLALPDPVRPKDRFAWINDPSNLVGKAPGHRGRRGEMLYQLLYPDATDINMVSGSTSLFDFEHDGLRVNVKTSRFILRADRSVYRWSFARGFLKEHNCDVYSCLCLDSTGQLVREYRIPSEIWGDRRVIHVYENEKSQWHPYLVPLQKEGLMIQEGSWSHSYKKDLTLASATEEIRSLRGESVPDHVVQILLRVPFPRRDYDQKRLLGDFLALAKSKAVTVDGTVVVGQSNAGLAFCDEFFEHRYAAAYKKSISVLSAWDDPDWLAKAVKFQVKVGDPLLPWNVFRALKALLRTPSNFRPSVARAVVEAFSAVGDTVFDPCAGYGGRAAGTLAAGRRYIGVDPHPQAGTAFAKMADFLGPNECLEFHNKPFEDTDFPEGSVDFAFTSPPYFSVERYADHPDQSWVRYTTWEAWRDSFLEVLIRKVFRTLKSGAAFCFNVADAKFGKVTYPLVEESVRLALKAGFSHEKTIAMPLGRFGKASKSEAILVFRKPM